MGHIGPRPVGFRDKAVYSSYPLQMLAMLGLVGSCLTLAQMFLLELGELETISWTLWEVPLLVSTVQSITSPP